MSQLLVNQVLLISDKELTIEFLGNVLEGERFAVRSARTAASAIESIRAASPDAIVCEQRVAGEGVLEILPQLAQIDSLADVPVIILASTDSSRKRGLLREAIRYGASDVIFKPADPDLLVRKIQMLLHARDMQRQRLDFISMLTRDLNGPITSITGYCRLLMRGSYGEIESEKIRKVIESIAVAGDRLRRQTSQFLYYTRLESGMLEFDFEKTMLPPLVEAASSDVRAELQDRTPSLDIDVQSNLPEIVCDPHELSVALKEAFRFSFANHGDSPESVRVFILHDEASGHVRCAITDRGIGHTAEQIEVLFDHYETINTPSSARDAFGMGLYLTRAIVEAQGGEVTLQSVPGEGTTLEIALTILPPNAKSDL